MFNLVAMAFASRALGRQYFCLRRNAEGARFLRVQNLPPWQVV